MAWETIIAPTVEGLGYECVDIELTPTGILRVFIDHPPEGVTIDDCALVSNHLTRVLAVEDAPYKTLEVSSPGLDRALKKREDFTRFRGALVKIKTKEPVGLSGQKKFTGRIRDFAGDVVTLRDEIQDLDYEIPYDLIDVARLKPELAPKRNLKKNPKKK